jgi:hypothetical protein
MIQTSRAKAKRGSWKGSDEEWRNKGTVSKSESKSGSSARDVTKATCKHLSCDEERLYLNMNTTLQTKGAITSARANSTEERGCETTRNSYSTEKTI